jgi:hypothetical protein
MLIANSPVARFAANGTLVAVLEEYSWIGVKPVCAI